MKLKELRYERKFFLGDFQTEGIGVMAELEEGDDPKIKLAELRKFIEDQGIFGREKSKALKVQNDSVTSAQSVTDKLRDATKEARNGKKGRPSKTLEKQEFAKGN